MRKKLKNKEGERLSFSANVSRFGLKPNYRGAPSKTILLENVVFLDTGCPATDHIWLTVGKTLEKADLDLGDTVKFVARIKTYNKGYVSHREGIDWRTVDYKLSHANNFVKI